LLSSVIQVTIISNYWILCIRYQTDVVVARRLPWAFYYAAVVAVI